MNEIDKQAKKDLSGRVSVSVEFIEAVREIIERHDAMTLKDIKTECSDNSGL